jgi:DNA-binding MarR family transcriptional regulator
VRITKDQMIEGLPAQQARQLMRGYYDPKGAWQAAEILDVSEADAVLHLQRFCSAGYLEASRDASDTAEWVTTITGNALAQASLAKPIKRTTAERHLQGVIERARAYNADSEKLLTVARLVVFGSYLDPTQEQLGDLDLAIQVVRRVHADEWSERCREYTARSGKHFARYIDKLFWPSRELIMHLKNRSSAINITDEDVSQLTKQYKCVYDVSEDDAAIQPPEGPMVQRF